MTVRLVFALPRELNADKNVTNVKEHKRPTGSEFNNELKLEAPHLSCLSSTRHNKS